MTPQENERLYLDLLRIRAGDRPDLSPARLAQELWGSHHPNALYFTERNDLFETYRINRTIMGAMRYGRLNGPNKPRYDRVASIRRRLEAYAATGNQEHLVDIANECMLEFTEPGHPKAHWAPADDPGLHTEVRND